MSPSDDEDDDGMREIRRRIDEALAALSLDEVQQLVAEIEASLAREC